MVNRGRKGDELSCKNYGVPLYGAAWVPLSTSAKEDDSATESEIPALSTVNRHIVLAGGGGEGRFGISNSLLVSSFDFESNSLSDLPVAELGTGSDLPYRMAVHPGGEGIVCSFLPKGCRWFEWDSPTNTDEQTLNLISSEKSLGQLEDDVLQLAMTFNSEGTLLAVGGEDGTLRVFKWPTMETTLSEPNAHSSVKDLDFSPDGKFLVSVGSGPARIWDVATSACVASLPNEDDEAVFGFCRFSRSTGTDQVLYVAEIRVQKGSRITEWVQKGSRIVEWDTSSWERISSTRVTWGHAISAFNVSPDGKLLAVGTSEGEIRILSCADMRVQAVIGKAHLGIVTVVAFSPDSRALVSSSKGSTARVTLVKDQKKRNKVSLLVILLFILLVLDHLYFALKPYF